MRSGTNCTINSGQVHSWALGFLTNAKLVKDHGWKCTAAIVLRRVNSGPKRFAVRSTQSPRWTPALHARANRIELLLLQFAIGPCQPNPRPVQGPRDKRQVYHVLRPLGAGH
jgi:hypothetical protein